MVATSRRRVVLAMICALSAVGLSAAGCGGDSKSKTLTIPVQPGESAEEWQQRALTLGQEACTVKNPPERVVFAVPKADEDTDVAAALLKLQLPTSASCSAYQSGTPEGEGTSTTAKG